MSDGAHPHRPASNTAARKRIVVIGGGVTGLACARRVAVTAGDAVEVTLLEQDGRLGGKVRTIDVNGVAVDAGPEALVTYQPAARELCRELGIDADLVSPAVNETRLFTRGRLRPLPPALMRGAPGGAWDIARSGVLSVRGLLRAGLDVVLPRNARADRRPISIGELVEQRIGREAAARLIDPLLGGVHAGSIWKLDAETLSPQIVSALRSHRSLIRGLRASASTAPASTPSASTPPAAARPSSPQPMFQTLRGGLEQLTRALAASAEHTGVVVRRGLGVSRVEPDGVVWLEDGTSLAADCIVAAVPAHALAALISHETAPQPAARAAAAMREIRWASTATCVMTFDAAAVGRALAGVSGVLIPRVDGEPIKAITCSTTKWHGDPVDGRVVLKCYLGNADDVAPITDASDEQIRERVLAALARIAGVTARPHEVRIERFAQALPQYEPGHKARVAQIESLVAEAFGDTMVLAGASWHGSGIGSCLASGDRAAQRALDAISHPQPSPSAAMRS